MCTFQANFPVWQDVTVRLLSVIWSGKGKAKGDCQRSRKKEEGGGIKVKKCKRFQLNGLSFVFRDVQH